MPSRAPAARDARGSGRTGRRHVELRVRRGDRSVGASRRRVPRARRARASSASISRSASRSETRATSPRGTPRSTPSSRCSRSSSPPTPTAPRARSCVTKAGGRIVVTTWSPRGSSPRRARSSARGWRWSIPRPRRAHAIAVAEAGGLAGLPCAMLSPHRAPLRTRHARRGGASDSKDYAELSVTRPDGPGVTRNAFDDSTGALVEELRARRLRRRAPRAHRGSS